MKMLGRPRTTKSGRDLVVAEEQAFARAYLHYSMKVFLDQDAS